MAKHEQFMDPKDWNLEEEQRKAALRIEHAKDGYRNIGPNEVTRLAEVSSQGGVSLGGAQAEAPNSHAVQEAVPEMPFSVAESLFEKLKGGATLNEKQRKMVAAHIIEQCGKVGSMFYGSKKAVGDLEYFFESLKEYGLEDYPLVDDTGKERQVGTLLAQLKDVEDLEETTVSEASRQLSEGASEDVVRRKLLTQSSWNLISNIKLPGYKLGLREFLVDNVIHKAKLANNTSQPRTPSRKFASGGDFPKVQGDGDIAALRNQLRS